MEGWVKLHRCLMEKAIWLQSTPEQKVILITLLTMANHREKQWIWQGKKFEAMPGQFVTSLDSIMKQCGIGISNRNIRTAIDKFENLEFLTNESTKTGRLITIVNWRVYQSDNNTTDKGNDKEVTKTRQSTDKDLTANKNVKNVKNDKKNIYGEFGKVLLTEKEHDKLVADYGVEMVAKIIKTLDEYIEEKGYKSKSHNLAIRRWVVDAVSKKQPQQKKQSKRDQGLDELERILSDYDRSNVQKNTRPVLCELS